VPTCSPEMETRQRQGRMPVPETEAEQAGAASSTVAGQAAAQWGLRRGGRAAYWGVIAPLAAWLPARLAYRVGCAWGDLTYRMWPDKASELEHLQYLRKLLGDDVLPEDVERMARDFCRFRACEVIDIMRLRGQARSLRRLVEIRGQEHLEAALENGRGAIICSAHFGSYLSSFSLLHTGGFPLTNLGRWDWNYHSEVSPAERRFWDFVYARRVLRHRQRPNIEAGHGAVQAAVHAAAVLRDNEVLMICSDAAPTPADRGRAVEAPFIGGQARLVPGVVGLAELTGAPVLMAFVHRSDDYRHQVLEISAPVSLEGDTETAFRRCVAAMDSAIRANPRDWYFWFQRDDLVALGLMPNAEADAELSR
jgi:KDO2-lipid IV(A) lauroyltransferase